MLHANFQPNILSGSGEKLIFWPSYFSDQAEFYYSVAVTSDHLASKM